MGFAPPTDLAPRLHGVHLSEIPVPNGREEEWRFTPMKRLRGLQNQTELASTLAVSVSSLQGVNVYEDDAPTFPAADRLAAAAAQLPNRATVVEIGADLSLAEPILIGVRGSADLALARLHVVIGSGTKCTLVLDQTGEFATGLAASFEIGDNANVELVSIQDAGSNGVLTGQHALFLGAHSNVDYRTATLGGGLVRMNTTVDYRGEGGTAKLAGAFFTTDGQHHEHRLFVGHELPNCTSDVVYKGAVQGDESHAVWVGDVLIRAAALGTKTYELNRNLLLTSGARADSVPNLEIETGQILGAGHASATGRFDEEQLFYLMSRGVPELEAKRLVVRGFLAEVINEIELPELRSRLWRRIDDLIGAGDPLFAVVADE